MSRFSVTSGSESKGRMSAGVFSPGAEGSQGSALGGPYTCAVGGPLGAAGGAGGAGGGGGGGAEGDGGGLREGLRVLGGALEHRLAHRSQGGGAVGEGEANARLLRPARHGLDSVDDLLAPCRQAVDGRLDADAGEGAVAQALVKADVVLADADGLQGVEDCRLVARGDGAHDGSRPRRDEGQDGDDEGLVRLRRAGRAVAHAGAGRLAGNGAGRTAREGARPRAPRHLQELDAAAALAGD